MCDIHVHDGPSETQAPETSGMQAFVTDLLLALQNSRVYRPDHPRVADSLRALAHNLERQLATLGAEVFHLGAADGYLFVDERPLLSASRTSPRLIRILEALGSSGLAFQQGSQPDEFFALAQVLGRKELESLGVLKANLELEAAGCRHIHFLSTCAESEPGAGKTIGLAPDTATKHPTLEVATHLYRDVYDHLTDVITSVSRGHPFRLGETKGHVEQILKSLTSDESAVMASSHYEHTDTDQFQFRHSIRVAYLALSFAKGLTRNERFLQRIGSAALLHDVGKGRLEDWSILHHPGRLNDEQRREMERHAELGARLLLELEDPDPMAVTIAFGHHRTNGGGGYPTTLHDAHLSLATRLVKICDVYEALTARRPHKDPMSPTRSYRIMLNMNEQPDGKQFDLPLLHRFILVNGIYPIGSWVRLDTNEVACVTRQTQDIEAPQVTVEREEGMIQGERVLFAVSPRSVDLTKPDRQGERRRIVEWVGYSEPSAA